MSKNNNDRIKILIALIGFIGVIGAALIGNIDKFITNDHDSTIRLVEPDKKSIKDNTFPNGKIKIKLKALVIGNSNYKYSLDLINTVNDAKDITDSLKSMGFTVTELLNIPKKELINSIRKHYSLAKEDNKNTISTSLTRGLVKLSPDKNNTIYLTYYSGHAVAVDGSQYLIPVDAKIGGIKTFSASEFIALSDILPSNFGIKPENNFLLYSTELGGVALDGDRTNSPFTKALLEGFEGKELDLYSVFKYVRSTVKKKTNGQQIPWMSISSNEEFVLPKLKNSSNINGGGSIVILDSCRDNPFKQSLK